MRGVHGSDKVKKLRLDAIEAFELVFTHLKSDFLVRWDESRVEKGMVIVVEGEDGTVESVRDGFAVVEGSEGVWMRHLLLGSEVL